MTRCVIVGAGHAGSELAIALRQLGYPGEIVLVNDQQGVPYQRPPLSKSYLGGVVNESDIAIRAAKVYERAEITLVANARTVSVDRASRVVKLCDGSTIGYEKLALTTGARPRGLSLGSVQLNTLHTLDDSRLLRSELRAGMTVVIVGGGFIGLETAATVTRLGARAIVVEARDRLMERACPPMISEFFAREHRSRGVEIRLGVTLRSVAARGGGYEVILSTGEQITADRLISGIGVIPNDELARGCGLDADDGVLVNEFAATSDANVVAAGDCTRQHNGFLGRRLRLESLHNASDQARIAARTICGLPGATFTAPWFWSDQFEHKLRMVGVHPGGAQRDVVGDPDSSSFTIVHTAQDVIVEVDTVNRPRDFAIGRRLVAGGATWSSRRRSARDASTLSDLFPSETVGARR